MTSGAARPVQAPRYTVESELATGGMGVVYRVFDNVAGEERALKRIRPDAKGKALYARAFEREYQVLATLDHPRIIRVFDYGVDEGGPYYTMELLSGHDMRDAAPLSYRDACLQLRDVATSLALLHARRLVHRDLSPGNVRMTRDGRCKLLDFGALSAFGFSDVVAGTPSSVPPEAFSGAPLDQRTDLYSLGALAYWMLTGRHAYSARSLEELPALWRIPPPPPSAIAPDVPKELDALVLRLLDADPLARPASAAEVIARFASIGQLPEEGTTETRRLALSFLANPRFIGRHAALERVESVIGAACLGHGGAVWIEAVAGMGRTRLLEEIGVRAQLAGAVVVRVDAGMVGQTGGTTRALVLRTADAVPQLARRHAGPFRAALGALGRDVRARLDVASSPPGVAADAMPGNRGLDRGLEEWFAAISADKPLVVQVDNADGADDVSLGMLAGLAALASNHPLVVVVTGSAGAGRSRALGLASFRERAVRVELTGLTPVEMLELCRYLFGNAPRVERFAEWLSEATAGSPLHALEVSRQLLAREVIRYSGGVWTLPDQVPDAELPAALGDAIAIRLASLTEPARILAECLSLQRQQSTFELCALLAPSSEGGGVLALLDELAEHDVVYAEQDGYRFSSTALREALLAAMDDDRRAHNHRRLGEAFAKLAGDRKPRLRIEAGWHFIRGGDEERGADLIASTTLDAVTGRDLMANLHRIGQPLEAALETYGKFRRSLYERLPLLATLAQAGYYEDRVWGDRYGNEALAAVEWLSGLATARHLRRFCGRGLALVVGILWAWLRFRLAPAAERKYSFAKLMTHLFATVTTMAGVAALSFDSERCDRIAGILEPFTVLPKRMTPVGIHDFCRCVCHISRESQAEAYDAAVVLLERFQDPRYYPTLPADARKFYIAGAHSVRGTFGIFRADGRGALESADALDRMGLELYAMVASQLRCLYYTMRADFAKAAVHRERVEIHAAHVGSVWQVETWEAAALLLVYPQIGDVVGSTHLAHRLERLSKTVPSLKRVASLARDSILLARGDSSSRPAIARVIAGYQGRAPRSYIGWAGSMGYVARGFNVGGDHAEAKRMCESTLTHLTEADREYLLHFITVDLELAKADMALGRPEDAVRRMDGLLARHANADHPLGVGLLHEVRAEAGWVAGKIEVYEQSLREVERRFLATQEPGLIAKCRRLAELGDPSRLREKGADPRAAQSSDPLAPAADASISSPAQLAETAIVGRSSGTRQTGRPGPRRGER
ncbi:MAG TPA: protein kinase [Polyangiaceae bacterium]|nr:protein kinase [Polyangiaceae bacterium]